MNIIKTLKDIADPRLTTREMESSQTRCGCDFQITSMFFEDLKPNFPVKTIGCIHTGQGWKIFATWNQNGECMVSGRRIKSFDLVTPDQREFDQAMPVFIGLIMFLIIVIGSILLQ